MQKLARWVRVVARLQITLLAVGCVMALVTTLNSSGGGLLGSLRWPSLLTLAVAGFGVLGVGTWFLGRCARRLDAAIAGKGARRNEVATVAGGLGDLRYYLAMLALYGLAHLAAKLLPMWIAS